jgi:hypothetical protein
MFGIETYVTLEILYIIILMIVSKNIDLVLTRC